MPSAPARASTVSAEEIYDALFDDEALDDLPRRLAQGIGARSALIGWIFPTGEQRLFAHCGYFTDEQMDLYVRDYAKWDPWTNALLPRLRSGDVIDLSEIVPDGEWENGVVFNELIRPLGDDMFRNVVVTAENRWGAGCVSFHRGRAQRGFDDSAVAELRGIAPQLVRMISLRARLTGLESALGSLRTMLDHASQAALLVGSDGRVIETSASGAALLEYDGPLCLSNARLGVRTGSRADLDAAVLRACDPSSPSSSSLLLAGGGGTRFVVTVIPVRGFTGARQALLLAQSLRATDQGLPERLRALFGLTRAEAEVATRLADGLSPTQIAAERRVATETVRTQIKHLAVKLGCSRQAEIAALVRTIVPIQGPR